MIKPKDFYNSLIDLNINFFTGVPDSLLKDICSYITDKTPEENNIIAANKVVIFASRIAVLDLV